MHAISTSVRVGKPPRTTGAMNGTAFRGVGAITSSESSKEVVSTPRATRYPWYHR